MAKWVCSIALLMALSFMYYLNSGLTLPKVLYIPQGSIKKIIAHLHASNPDISAIDGLFIRLIGVPQHGWIDLGNPRLTHGDFVYSVCNARAAMKPITLIPGETTVIFLDQLARSHGLDTKKLMAAFNAQSPFPEGPFVPDTYMLPLGISEADAVALLLKQSARTMRRWATKIFGTYNPAKWQRYLILASIIQKEAADTAEMPYISSVIYNRLAKGMRLQMDGTLNYGRHSHTPVTAGRIRSDTSSYNTYRYAGLPPAPVCNVSFDAIKAAIFPVKSDYLYFTKGSDGKHRFTRYFSTHKRNILRDTK